MVAVKNDENPAGFQHAETLAPDVPDIMDIDVRNRMDDEVEFTVPERESFTHIGADDPDRVLFAIAHVPLAAELLFGEIHDRNLCALRRQKRSLLPAAIAGREPMPR